MRAYAMAPSARTPRHRAGATGQLPREVSAPPTSRGAHPVPETGGTARPAPGTLAGRTPGGWFLERGTPGVVTLRADGLDLAFRRAVDGHSYRWPAQARQVTVRHLELWRLGGFAEAAQLLVSELVSNAVCHGHGDVTLRLTCRHDEIRLDVTTDATQHGARPCPYGTENLPAPGDDEESGRGLLIVDAFASRWDISEDGNHAWCCLTNTDAAD
ncbi:ATP-binding protein [Streptomyces xinghaiensis]|uniref:ATP-binding protein n=1 Tax=Streptomyces xinghaiensis TaxID=1038928 RepID=A0A3M8EX67_9ACTN|nr:MULTISPECIES: ATP-binding protein [Streptomyces]PQM20578.1 ATP-binding protein [Streptomyces xinghaiensis]RKM92520.1 ATP-binding protein [Streptomyces xinghaiensis]RNC70487.1 ATP-binding protein [Streptomyces xinghaiensis]